MTSDSERLSLRLVVEGEKTVEFFRSLPPELLNREVYADGARWQVGQLVTHFLVTEIGIYRLVENILDGNPGTPDDFDVDSYNEKKVADLRDLPVEVVLERFIDQRRKSAGVFANLTPEQLDMQGRHPYLGITRVGEIIKLLYLHNQLHQRDIRRLMSESPLQDSPAQ